MSYLNLSDRLKAAVNSIDAAGTHLQQRALGQNAPQQAPQISQPGAASPSTPTSKAAAPTIQTAPTGLQNQSTFGSSAPRDPALATSPTKAGHPYSAANALAEGALSNLRKSFNFSRQSLDHARSGPSSPRSPSTSVLPTSPIQELKDIPSPNPSSRPSSPARFLSTATQFSLGSDPSTAMGTPRPKSPLPRSKSPLQHPPPDPDDPATYPLPPSPSIPSSPLPVPSALFADPLGASPLLPPADEAIVPALEIEGPTPQTEEKVDAAQLGVPEATEKSEVKEEKVEPAAEPESKQHDEPVRISVDGPRQSHDSTRAAALSSDDAASQLANAERRYEGKFRPQYHIATSLTNRSFQPLHNTPDAEAQCGPGSERFDAAGRWHRGL